MKKDTINKKEIDKFSKLADEWWDPEGKFKPLHNFNPVRLRYIKASIVASARMFFITDIVLKELPCLNNID